MSETAEVVVALLTLLLVAGANYRIDVLEKRVKNGERLRERTRHE